MNTLILLIGLPILAVAIFLAVRGEVQWNQMMKRHQQWLDQHRQKDQGPQPKQNSHVDSQ